MAGRRSLAPQYNALRASSGDRLTAIAQACKAHDFVYLNSTTAEGYGREKAWEARWHRAGDHN
eukprot:6060731-Pyramimonas_sp.AAC.1